MIYFLLIYIVFYIVWSFYSIREDLKIKATFLVTLQLIALIIGVVGMVLFTFSININILKVLWKGLFVLFVLGEGISFHYDFKEIKRDPEISNMWAVIAIIISLILIIPAICINYFYAYVD